MERIYLDYNATSLIYPEVTSLMVKMLQESSPSNASSIHYDGRRARGLLETARSQIAKTLAIDAYKDDLQIIFTSCGTEANNMVVSNYQDMPMFACSTEHVSILEAGHKNLHLIPVDKNGLIDPQKLQQLLSSVPGKKLVAIMLANNETGVIQDITFLSQIVHAENGILHCDASQAFGKIKVNFKDLGCDSLSISSHKCGGPLGSAALITKKSLNLQSLIKGGKQELGMRSGTENLLAIAGFGLAAEISLEKFALTTNLRNYLEQEIAIAAPEAKFFGRETLRLPNTSSIRMPNVKSEEQLIKFDLGGISVSAGSACSSGRISSSHVLRAMEIEPDIASETIRVSLGPATCKADIDEFIKQWKKIYNDGN